MLGSLQSDLNKLGVATVAKGVCGACKKPIAGQVIEGEGEQGREPQVAGNWFPWAPPPGGCALWQARALSLVLSFPRS